MKEENSSYEIQPLHSLDAVVEAPGSKSYTQRALVIAALAEGVSTLVNPLVSEDTLYLANALRDMGAGIVMGGNMMFVRGTGGRPAGAGREIFLGNNGTAMRLLISVAALGRGEYTLAGDRRLCERPVKHLLDALAQLGAEASALHSNGCPPVRVRGGTFRGGQALLRDIDSSQYISSLLIAAPFAQDDVEIVIRGKVPSRPYVELTIETMRAFGAEAVKTPDGYRARAGLPYAARRCSIEGDFSSASYFFLAAALCGGKVRVENINPGTLQGDIRILDVMELFGCEVRKGESWVEVAGGGPVRGEMEIDMGDMPDMVPTAAVLAAVRPDRTVIRNVGHLRVKESDRIRALASELRKIGAAADEMEDGLIIEGGGAVRGAEIETWNDHRIAMSFAVLGLAAAGMRVRDPGCVGKSFPGFWRALEGLRRQGGEKI